MVDTKLKGKVVLITGANHGIGAATAKAFAAEEALVVIHYLDASPPQKIDETYTALHQVKGKIAADDLVQEIKDQGGRAMAIAGDLANPTIIPLLFDWAEAAYGHIDVLVNNAAHCEDPDTIFSTSAESLDRTFAVNTRAPVLLIAEFARRYQDRGATWGRIVNISTDAAQTFPSQIAYGASKAATEAFTRSLACELGPLGLTVNIVAPGPVQTGYITPTLEKKLLPEIPLERVGQPEDIADVVVFLASDQARWLTGQVIKVAGGHIM